MNIVPPDNTNPSLNPPLPNRPAELIFQLGTVQCFWFPTAVDVASNRMAYDVYWRDSRYSHTFGPFPSMFNAMSHCEYLANGQKSGFVDMKQPDLQPDRPSCPLIMVDFRMKQRVLTQVPGGDDGKV